MTTRRNFLSTSSLAAVGAVTMPWGARIPGAHGRPSREPAGRPRRRAGEPDLRALAQRAIEAATAAGASYVEVRFTVTDRRSVTGSSVNQKVTLEDSQEVAVGVRALTRGAWGFAADTELTPDTMAWLGRTAVELGKAGSWRGVPPVTLGPPPTPAAGHWQTPVTRDPFTVSDKEYKEVVQAIMAPVVALAVPVGTRRMGVGMQFNFERQERTFASSTGAFATQTIHTAFSTHTGESSGMTLFEAPSERTFNYPVAAVSPKGMGFEVFEREQFVARMPEWIAELTKLVTGQQEFTTPGRFEVVLDGHAMAAVVNSLGAALEVDRALGYQAADDGTSYLAPVAAVLGTQPFPAALTLTGNRTQPGGAATVRWDDEGVPAQEFPLVRGGTLVDYATSREFVAELAPGYRTRGQAAQSRGCAGAETALAVPLVQTPNLQVQAGAQDTSFEELLAGVDDGIAILGGDVSPDQQQLTLLGTSDVVYTVKKGKLGVPLRDVAYMASMPELWKNLVALGGERSVVTRGFGVSKEARLEQCHHSVRAPAARFRNITVRQISI